MSTVFKKFSKSDVSITPFTAHKKTIFSTTSSLIEKGGSIIEAYYPSSSYKSGFGFEWANSSSNDKIGGLIDTSDSSHYKKYLQLDHLFYKNSKLEYHNKFSKTKYFDHYRKLYDRVQIISLPYKTIGYKIKPGSFYLRRIDSQFRDDGKGNLYPIVYGSNHHFQDINGNFTPNIKDFYFKDENSRIFHLGPERGHKYYNLNIQDGVSIVNPESSYSKEGLDDSFLLNEIKYNDVKFAITSNRLTGSYGSEHKHRNWPTVEFNGSTSYISSPHNSRLNFNSDDDFAISFFISASNQNPNDNHKRYIISKSTKKTVIQSSNLTNNTKITGSSQAVEVNAEPQFPFEIYYQSSSVHFNRFDGDNLSGVSAIATQSLTSRNHITASNSRVFVLCQKTGSNLEIYVNNRLYRRHISSSVATTVDKTLQTQNKANLYIGSKGGVSNFFSGSINQINIFEGALSSPQIQNLLESIDNKPFVGNVFYDMGFATITKPSFVWGADFGANKVGGVGVSDDDYDDHFHLEYQGTHLIYENEYQCMAEQHEFDVTLNPSARKIKSKDSEDLANFATGSDFKPYVTTIGLYNDNGELLVVGKLGQAIRMSDEADTTYVVRFDT